MINLTKNSSFNFVNYNEILEFVKLVMNKGIVGVFNIATIKNVALTDIAKFLKKEIKYGNIEYITPMIDNSKTFRLLPRLERTSLDVIK
ncbi:MAG: hypothetical protein NZ870_00030 [bacterium]|nr:hypothetical protein [bacterium]